MMHRFIVLCRIILIYIFTISTSSDMLIINRLVSDYANYLPDFAIQSTEVFILFLYVILFNEVFLYMNVNIVRYI